MICFFNFLVKNRGRFFIGKVFYILLRVIGVDIPVSVKIGKNVRFHHWAIGSVIHNNVQLKDNVRIYQGVTLGRADIFRNSEEYTGIIVEEGAIICAGAKVLCKDGILRIGKNSILGANSVVLKSVGDNEVWAGNPAKFIKVREVID